ncbi:hypothetical protein E8E13_006070 [Curvularia kusanoi]|uniref:Protein kinase domain-containing protein n=1 Tax=Curvularia kusanoi TaxID=90978 RepID=A0A9P4TDY7_CURKU|nr:hypothetical protein E8E13_006070 [Curvularia kusanoi]
MAENMDFDAYCNLLYQNLARHACYPRTETDGAGPSINKNGVFFPEGTAEEALSIRKLGHLFNHILRSGSPACRDISGTAANLAQRVVERELRKLPIDNFTFVKSILGSDATTALFLEKQYEFLAPVIKKYEEVKGDFRRVPYVRERLIGRGSFGMVYEVEISPQHFQDETGLSNLKNLPLARKDFVLSSWDKAYDKEREVLREIVRNGKKNDNIMESWGSLEFGTTYSLFMPLADCDLMKYMESRSPPQSLTEKAAFIKCAVDLSGAIAFLHDQLESPFYEKLSCIHMDLKPQNILVVINSKGEQTWKVSDFNMSRVKGSKRISDNEHLQLNRSTTFYEINRLFRQEKPSTANSFRADSTINRRGTGTYLAPEACIGDPVQAESDIWSLGCVISVVFTYMCKGFAGVEEFSRVRSQNSRDATDCFFTLPQKKMFPKIGDIGLNDGVLKWLKRLRTTQPTNAEKAILEDLTRFLTKHVFVIDPIRRRKTTANQIRGQLVAAFKAYRQTSEPHEERTSSPRKRSIFGFRNSALIFPPIRLDITLDSPLIACVLGSKAHPLVCVTPTKLVAYRILDITSEAAVDNLDECGNATPCNGQLWSKHVAASTQHIIAATDNKEIEFYLYKADHSGQFGLSTGPQAHWTLNCPGLRKLAMSRDGQYVALVVQSGFHGNPKAMLYIAGLDGLLSTQTDRPQSITSSASGSSSDAGNILGDATLVNCSVDDIYEMVFSKANILYIVSKPRHTRQVQRNEMTVHAWKVADGRRTSLQPVIITHNGNNDLSHGLLTAFTPFSQTPGFTVVTEKTRVMSYMWQNDVGTDNWKAYSLSTSSTGRYRILHIFWDTDDRTLLALGVEQSRSLIHLLAITNVAKRSDPKFESLATFPDLREESVTSGLFTLAIDGSTGQDCLFITTIDRTDRIETGPVRLFRVPLPRRPR